MSPHRSRAVLIAAVAWGLACPADGGSRRPAETEPLPRAKIQIGLQVLDVEVAETPDQKSQGLSGRPHLPEGHGMWFPYQTPGRLSFWMKDMHFPLDFVWVHAGVIVGLTENVSPAGGSGTLVRPGAPADGALEVPAGTIARWGWKLGDRVEIEPVPD